LFCRRVQQPHQKKEGHHRSHKVRIGNLPSAAMMSTTSNHFFAFDYYDWRICFVIHDHSIFLTRDLVSKRDMKSGLTDWIGVTLVA
jgi:hypothetical protein